MMKSILSDIKAVFSEANSKNKGEIEMYFVEKV